MTAVMETLELGDVDQATVLDG
ncbi:hypothetical protein LCGC14_1966560, partial [marine sediment metagenome]